MRHQLNTERRPDTEKGYGDTIIHTTTEYLVCTCGTWERRVYFADKRDSARIDWTIHALEEMQLAED